MRLRQRGEACSAKALWGPGVPGVGCGSAPSMHALSKESDKARPRGWGSGPLQTLEYIGD